MPKTFPIMIEVEEIALGPVLRRLNEMPGIAKLHLDLGHGGAGKDRPEQGASHAVAKASASSLDEAAVKLLAGGPMHIRAISAGLGGARSRAYGVMTRLRVKGLAQPGDGPGMHQLTSKGVKSNGATNGATPPQVTHGPKGRATPGSGNRALLAGIEAGAVTTSALRDYLASAGMSSKSIPGVIVRAKRDGLIKMGGDGYELTAKGQKTNGVANHG
jgi:hypothetical protein